MKKNCFFETGIWLKGNLHSHTTVSDGSFRPQELAECYLSRGYDFLSMTDHNVFVPHGECPELLQLTGVEHDIEYSADKCLHLVGIGAAGKETTDYPCRRYKNGEISEQQLLELMLQDGQFVTVAHPWWSRMEPEELFSLEGFDAIEVFNNGTERLCHGGQGELLWDLLLRRGRRIYAMASDDVHGPEDLFGGWICVKARERSIPAILDALREGSFYASNGPDIRDFIIEDGIVRVKCTPCRAIHFVTYSPRGKSFFAQEQLLTEASFRLRGRENYVRLVCEDTEGHCAWSQPLFL